MFAVLSLSEFTCQHLLLLVGFDTLTYLKHYDRSPRLVGHQETFSGVVVGEVNKLYPPTPASLPGSVALLVSEVGKETFTLCVLFFILLLLPSVLMDPSSLGPLLVRSRPTAMVVAPTHTEIVPYKIPTCIIDYVLANRYT